MKRAVVTGATSFIGVHLVNRLILEGWKVYAVARKGSRRVALLPLNEQIEIVYLDMEEYSKLGESIKEAAALCPDWHICGRCSGHCGFGHPYGI